MEQEVHRIGAVGKNPANFGCAKENEFRIFYGKEIPDLQRVFQIEFGMRPKDDI